MPRTLELVVHDHPPIPVGTEVEVIIDGEEHEYTVKFTDDDYTCMELVEE